MAAGPAERVHGHREHEDAGHEGGCPACHGLQPGLFQPHLFRQFLVGRWCAAALFAGGFGGLDGLAGTDEGGGEFGALERLAEVVVHAGGEAVFAVAVHGIGG